MISIPGIVPFSIVVNDSSEDNLSVLCYYKIPNETEWIYFHEFEDINPPYSDSYGYAWSTLDMINLQEIDENIYIKIIPSDGFEPGISDSVIIYLDNNNVPSVSFNNDEIPNENNGDVEISFVIDNDEGDADSSGLNSDTNQTESTSPSSLSIRNETQHLHCSHLIFHYC